MEEYGKIRLYNAQNDMLDMTNPDMFGADQEGLGVQFESEFRTADSHFLIEKSDLQRKTLSLNLWLGDRTGQSYQRFSDLVAFLNHTPYRIKYETPTGIWSRDCILNELTKSLIKEESILVEELQLDFTTPFYIERSERTTDNPSIEGKAGKIYETVTRKRQVFETVPESYREGDLWHWQGELGILNSENRKDYKIPKKIKNEIINGDFSQGVSAWSNGGYQSSYKVIDGVAVTTDLSTINRGMHQTVNSIVLGHKYYIKADIQTDFFEKVTNVRIFAGQGVNDADYSQFPRMLDNLWHTYSTVLSYRQTKIVRLYVQFIEYGAYPVSFDNASLIDLTTTFGAGNEPTKSEMDELITLLGGWFDGTVTVPRYFIATRSSNEFNFNDFVYYGQSANENTYYDKIYDYTYSYDDYSLETEESYYTYDYVYADEDEGKNVFQVDNHSVYIGSSKHSPCEITIYGPCENPHWQITQGSKILQSDGFNLTVPEGHRLVVSSNPQSQRAVLIALDGTVSNVYQQQDLSKSNFVTFPVGRSKILFFNCDKVSFRYREERVTV